MEIALVVVIAVAVAVTVLALLMSTISEFGSLQAHEATAAHSPLGRGG